MPPLHPIPTHLGDYRLLERLGAGGMGEVYRAVHARLGRVVAVKVLSEPRAPALQARFRNEARIQSALRHPHIATLYEFFEHGGRACLVMEYVEGPTLADRVARGPLPVEEALRLFRQVVQAVDYLHRRGIVHRDVKPHNLKLTAGGQVKLLDFGIAKGAATPTLTRTGYFVGTPQYLAPEQVQGGAAGPASDVWALGVVLYELLTGRLPFEGRDAAVLYAQIARGSYRPAGALNATVPRALEALLARCLRRRPRDRFASAGELLAALDRLARDGTPRPWPARLPRAWRLPAAAATLLGVLLLGWALLHGSPGGPAGRVAVTVQAEGGSAEVLTPEGLHLGRTPYVMQAAPGTAVALVLRRDGYRDTPAHFTVEAAQPEARFRLLPADALPVTVRVAEGEADVFAPDGTWLGRTPYLVDGRRGTEVDLILRRRGYRDAPVRLEINERRTEYVFPMDKIEAPAFR